MSIISDGLAAALALKAEDHESFDVLTRVPVRFKYPNGDLSVLSKETPHIVLGGMPGATLTSQDDGHGVSRIVYSGRLDHPMPSTHDTDLYFRARARFCELLKHHSLEFQLEPGDLLLLDNDRVLHGRSTILASSSSRHLQGVYIARDSVIGRWRALKEMSATGPSPEGSYRFLSVNSSYAH